MTIPGLAVGLIALAAADRLAPWFGRRSWLPWQRSGRRRRDVSSTAFDEMHATLYAGKRLQLEQRRTEQLLRDDAEGSAPPRTTVDLDRRTAVIRLPRRSIPGRRTSTTPPSGRTGRRRSSSRSFARASPGP